jgi:hypothetical protein
MRLSEFEYDGRIRKETKLILRAGSRKSKIERTRRLDFFSYGSRIFRPDDKLFESFVTCIYTSNMRNIRLHSIVMSQLR